MFPPARSRLSPKSESRPAFGRPHPTRSRAFVSEPQSLALAALRQYFATPESFAHGGVTRHMERHCCTRRAATAQAEMHSDSTAARGLSRQRSCICSSLMTKGAGGDQLLTAARSARTGLQARRSFKALPVVQWPPWFPSPLPGASWSRSSPPGNLVECTLA